MKPLFLILAGMICTLLITAQPTYKLSLPGSVERKLSDRLADEISVLDFGAKGDGSTNDTKAFEQAIAAANGRAISLQGRTYAVNLMLTRGQVRINGNGGKLIPSTSGKAVITLKPEKYIYDVQFSDLEINGDGKRSDGIYITNNSVENGADFITLNNVVIKFCRYGFNVEGRSIWNKFYNCKMDWNVGGLRIRTALDCNLWDVSATTFNFNDAFGVWIQNLAAAKQGFKNFKFQSCNFDGNAENATEGYGGYFDGLEMLVLDNMYVEGNCKKGDGYGIKITGVMGRGFSINGGWFGDCKYPIVIDGEKKWGSISNVMADSKGYNSEGAIFIRSNWVNNEPKITLSNCLGKVVSKTDAQGNNPLKGIDWFPFETDAIDLEYRDWLKIFAKTKNLQIKTINGLYNGRRFGLINYTTAGFNVVIDGSLMHDGKAVTLLPNTTREFLVDGYPTEGKLRPIN